MNPQLKDKLWSVAKGAAIAAVGAGLAYGVQALSSLAGGGDLGAYGPAIAALAAIAANIVRKAMTPEPVAVIDEDGPDDDDSGPLRPFFPFNNAG